MVSERFLAQPHRDMLIIESDLDAVLDRFSTYLSPTAKPFVR
jgi:hypothetical protein